MPVGECCNIDDKQVCQWVDVATPTVKMSVDDCCNIDGEQVCQWVGVVALMVNRCSCG